MPQWPDNVPPLETWAPWARRLWHEGYNKHKAHFQLWQMLWVSGVPPKTCTYWVRQRWTGHLRTYFYQSAQFERYAEDEVLRNRYLLKGRVWDCNLRRPEYLGGNRTAG